MEYIQKYRKPLFILSIILLSPIVLSTLNIAIEFIFKSGRIFGTTFRIIQEILINML